MKGRRRKAVSRKRLTFGMRRPKTVRLPPPRHLPDEETLIMSQEHKQSFAPTLAGSSTNATEWGLVAMNNVYDPQPVTSVPGGMVGGMPTCSGFTAQNALYTYWQVRDAKITVTVNSTQSDNGTTICPPIDIILLPLGSVNSMIVQAAPLTTYSWDRLLGQPYCSRVKTLKAMDAGTLSKVVLRHHMAPGKLEGTPMYYGQVGTWGANATTPPAVPSFHIFMRHIETIVGPVYNLEVNVKIEYSVRWWGRYVIPIAREPPIIKAHVETKEEKEDEADGLSLTPLVVMEPPTPLSMRTPKPWTCLNPKHVGAHIQSSTCL